MSGNPGRRKKVSELAAYGDFWDKARGVPIKPDWGKEIRLASHDVANELARVLSLSDELKAAYELAVGAGDSEGFWEAVRQLEGPIGPERSSWSCSSNNLSTTSPVPPTSPVLAAMRTKNTCVVELSSVKFSFSSADEDLEADVKRSLKWMSLAALAVSRRLVVPEGKHAPWFKPLGVERRQMLASNLDEADFFEWPVDGPYNWKWRKIANWLNGYILHLCKTVWSWDKRVLEPRLLYIGKENPLNMDYWSTEARKMVAEVIPASWESTKKPQNPGKRSKGSWQSSDGNVVDHCYPKEPAFVLWCHADPDGKPGLFSKVKSVVSGLLEEYVSVFNPRIADFSGVFWKLNGFSMDWGQVTVLNLTDNDIFNTDLDGSVSALVKLCPKLKKMRIMAGNQVTLHAVEKMVKTFVDGVEIY